MTGYNAIVTPSRSREVVRERDKIIRDLYERTDLTLVEIGRVVKREHSSVLRSLRRHVE